MTGFSSTTSTIHSSQGNPIQVTAHLKTLNSRFFEATCKLPHSLAHLETDLIKLFKSKLHRGSIHCSIYIHNPSAFKSLVTPSYHVIENYVTAFANIQERFNLPGLVNIQDIVQLPHVFEVIEEALDEATTHTFMQLVEQLIEKLFETRVEEGAFLRDDIEQRLKNIATTLDMLEPHVSQAIATRQEQLLTALNSLPLETSAEMREQQLQAIHHQLDKMDVHEEIMRFKTHLQSMRTCLSDAGYEHGKKLDFIVQELFREVHTMMSKCNDATVSGYAISIKVELEKIREQAQNIV